MEQYIILQTQKLGTTYNNINYLFEIKMEHLNQHNNINKIFVGIIFKIQ